MTYNIRSTPIIIHTQLALPSNYQLKLPCTLPASRVPCRGCCVAAQLKNMYVCVQCLWMCLWMYLWMWVDVFVDVGGCVWMCVACAEKEAKERHAKVNGKEPLRLPTKRPASATRTTIILNASFRYVCVCVCMCVCVCVCVCMCVFLYVSSCIHISTCVYMRVRSRQISSRELKCMQLQLTVTSPQRRNSNKGTSSEAPWRERLLLGGRSKACDVTSNCLLNFGRQPTTTTRPNA